MEEEQFEGVGGLRFWVDKLSDYVEDVATFVRLAKQHDPDLPVFVWSRPSTRSTIKTRARD